VEEGGEAMKERKEVEERSMDVQRSAGGGGGGYNGEIQRGVAGRGEWRGRGGRQGTEVRVYNPCCTKCGPGFFAFVDAEESR
jgi:hypothetical protein